VQSFNSDLPDYLPSNPPTDVDPDAPIIDLVFTDFVQDDVLSILNQIQNDTTYTADDVGSYSSCELNCVLGLYAQQAWN
jgi:hypothetical protein